MPSLLCQHKLVIRDRSLHFTYWSCLRCRREIVTPSLADWQKGLNVNV